MKIFDQITNAHGWISDKDFIWWPFSFLRPEPNTPMSFGHICLMTLCFSGLSIVMYSVYAIANNAFDGMMFIRTAGLFFGGFFIWFNVVTRPLWNRRSRQLQRGK